VAREKKVPALPGGEARARAWGRCDMRSINVDPAWWFPPRQARSTFFPQGAGMTGALQPKPAAAGLLHYCRDCSNSGAVGGDRVCRSFSSARLSKSAGGVRNCAIIQAMKSRNFRATNFRLRTRSASFQGMSSPLRRSSCRIPGPPVPRVNRGTSRSVPRLTCKWKRRRRRVQLPYPCDGQLHTTPMPFLFWATLPFAMMEMWLRECERMRG
jgi:hypothetical protein